MLKIPNRNLPAQAVTLLDQYQADVDAAGDYATCVAAAKSTFKSRNRATNPAFSAVRTKLTEMCSGIGRCMYCEDAPADEVEHHRPKDLYPELVFVWRNYLYACGPCNGPKNNRFARHRPDDPAVGQCLAPEEGAGRPACTRRAPALLDPRQEDPLDFLMLDLRDTFYLTPPVCPGDRRVPARGLHTGGSPAQCA
jgi:5-methylcytosine-specific restriction endonuclease McrA